jgi:hypothetical protein
MYMLQLYHEIERFIDLVKVTSLGYDVMGLYTAGRPCDVTKCGTARYVLELTSLRKNIFMLKMKKRTRQYDDRLLWLQAKKDFPFVYNEVFKHFLSCFAKRYLKLIYTEPHTNENE